MAKNIFWDLDGTLTDSSLGILNCVELSLQHFGITDYVRENLTYFIGPPLRESFPMAGIKPEDVEEAIRIYRGRYNVEGKYENIPYTGIRELLEKLKTEGYHNYVATSKPEAIAKDILAKFELADFFDEICGATEDGSIASKEEVIEYLLTKVDVSEGVIMVGDSQYDVIGAKAHEIETVVVTWGFGDEKLIEEAGPKAIVSTMEELYEALQN